MSTVGETTTEFCRLILQGFSKDFTSEKVDEVLDSYKTFLENLTSDMQSNNLTEKFVAAIFPQISICLRNVQKIVKMEEKHKVSLARSREYFLNRILECLEKLKQKCLNGEDYSDDYNLFKTFLHIIKDVANLVAPYTEYTNGIPRTSEFYEAAVKASNSIHTLSEELIEPVAEYAKVVSLEMRRKLESLSQEILRESKVFQSECMKGKGNDNNVQVQADILILALRKLNDYACYSSKALIYDSFTVLERYSMDNLKNFFKSDFEEHKQQNVIDKFNLNLVKINHIGKFCIAFVRNPTVQIKLHSSLALINSLQSVLIPSLRSKDYRTDLKMFCKHFNEEMTNFMIAVFQIIDSNLFCEAYLEICQEFVDQFSASTSEKEIEDILIKGTILKDQLKTMALDQHIFVTVKSTLEDFHRSKNSAEALVKLKSYMHVVKRLVKLFDAQKRKHSVKKETDICTELDGLTLEYCESYESFNSSQIISSSF